jgi:large repetitive protein
MRTRVLSLRGISASTAAAVAIAGLAIGLAPSASANPAPPVQRSASGVTADALPTVQIDGVVWSQTVVGNTVYAGGNFANARPAGAAPGTHLTPRANLLAYNITTGALITSFAPSLNAQAKVVAASPDGTRVYVGGQFTAANGVTRNHIAAYSTSTGALISSFAPTLDATVETIAATNTTVYVGGAFSSVNGVARAHIAALNASNGSLTAWAPTIDNNEPHAMVLTPDKSRLIVGGSFTSVNHSTSAYGLAALDTTTGALRSWAANSVVRDAGVNAAILDLTTDGTNIYGNGYVFGAGGNLEGAFAADPDTGTLKWIEDCHGDTYQNFPVNGVVYTVSHDHFCGNVGGFPQTNPFTYHRALAFTVATTGTLLHNTLSGYFDFGGQPSPSLVNWFPDLAIGSFTGQDQAAWSVRGSSQYITLGGEFPSVNGVAQQGLVRFAVPPIAPSKQGPMVSGANFRPTLTAVSSTTVRVSWQANWDRDDQVLTYNVVRDGNVNHPFYTTKATSQFWNLPTLTVNDSCVPSGGTHQYRLNASDPSGNLVWGDTVSITIPAAGASTTQLCQGQSLVQGHALHAGSYQAIMQTDGNFVVYGKHIWQTKTYGKGGYRFILQTDGNLVVYTAASKALWQSKTYGRGGTRLVMQTDGNLVLYTAANHPVWWTSTN